MVKKFIIWDFDGTIANTNNVIIESWQATFRRYLGHEMPVKEIEATFGETLYHTMAEKLPDVPYEEARDFYRDYQDANCAGKVYVFPGVREVMDEMRARGHKIGIATSRTARSFWKYMKELDLEDYVDVLVSMEDVEQHKPHPESLFKVLEKFGAEPGDAIMIGDTKYDVGCAQNAGVDSVLVGWSHFMDEESMAADGYAPTYRVANPGDLLELLDS